MNSTYRTIVFFITIMYSVCSLGQIELGGKIGYSHTNTAKVIRGKSYNSFVGGLTSSWKIRKGFYLNGDILFVGRGYVVDEGIYDATNSVYQDCKVTFKYIDIPLLLEFDVNNHLSIEFGPYVGMQVARNLYYDNEKQNRNLLGKRQPFDMGVLAGIKGKYKGAFMELLYQRGFTQAFKDVKGFETKGVCVYVGYMFNLT